MVRPGFAIARSDNVLRQEHWHVGGQQISVSLTKASDLKLTSSKRLPPSRKKLSSIANTGSMTRIHVVLTVLNTRCNSKRKTRALSTGSPMRPHGPYG